MKKDDIVLTAVIAVGCTATAFAFVFLIKLGVKQEPLFALIGTLIGAAAAIGGAVWLADRNRNLERDAEVALLAKEYSKLLKTGLAAQEMEPEPDKDWPKDYRPRLYTLAEVAGDVHAVGKEALSHGKALSFLHRASVRRVQFAIDEYLRFWSDANRESDLEPWDERSFPGTTADVVQECKNAIAELSSN